jgi:hypothetical protein
LHRFLARKSGCWRRSSLEWLGASALASCQPNCIVNFETGLPLSH